MFVGVLSQTGPCVCWCSSLTDWSLCLLVFFFDRLVLVFVGVLLSQTGPCVCWCSSFTDWSLCLLVFFFHRLVLVFVGVLL